MSTRVCTLAFKRLNFYSLPFPDDSEMPNHRAFSCTIRTLPTHLRLQLTFCHYVETISQAKSLLVYRVGFPNLFHETFKYKLRHPCSQLLQRLRIAKLRRDHSERVMTITGPFETIQKVQLRMHCQVYKFEHALITTVTSARIFGRTNIKYVRL